MLLLEISWKGGYSIYGHRWLGVLGVIHGLLFGMT